MTSQHYSALPMQSQALIHRALRITIIACSFVIGFASCSKQESRVESGNKQQIFHIGNGTEPQGLDPHVSTGVSESNIKWAIFEGLTNRHPSTQEPIPGIAEKWDVSEDGKHYRFFIRENAKWSNGDPLTAKDVVFSWERALNPKMGNQYAFMLFPIENAEAYQAGKVTNFSKVGVKIVNSHTLDVTLTNPTPTFLQSLSHSSAFILHEASIIEHGSPYARYSKWTRPGNLISSGPFKLTEWKLYKHIKVERNKHYWGADGVSLNAIVFYPTENLTTEERMFRVGGLHQTYEFPLNKADYYRNEKPQQLKNTTYLGTYYYLFNVTRPPFDDVRVRRAFSYAIDRDAIVENVLHNIHLPGLTFTPPGINGYQPPVKVGYDPEKARELLAQAGYPNGEGFPEINLLFNTDQSHQKIAVAAQQMWKEVLNVDVGLTNQEWKVYLDTRINLNYDIARAGWIGDLVDPITFLDLGYSKNGNNHSGYKDPVYDNFISKEIPETRSLEERNQKFYEAENYLMDALPFMPIYTYKTRFLSHESVHGVTPNLLNRFDYRQIKLIPPSDGEEK